MYPSKSIHAFGTSHNMPTETFLPNFGEISKYDNFYIGYIVKCVDILRNIRIQL